MERFDLLYLAISDKSHEQAYVETTDRWESLVEKIAPQLLGRKSGMAVEKVSYPRWLAWREYGRTTGASLLTQVPCTLCFLMESSVGIFRRQLCH